MYGTLRIFQGSGNGSFTLGNIPITGNIFTDHASWLNVADFNNDQIPDLSVANSGRSHTLLLGKGDGTFIDGGTIPTVGDLNTDAAVADFNGDGRPDLATITYVDALVSVFMNTGNGSFAPLVNYQLDTGPYMIAVGDFNGDGKPDLAVPRINQDISILINNGDGTFKLGASVPVEPYFITTADYNRDGITDIASGGGGSGGGAPDRPVQIYLGNKSGVLTNGGSFPAGGEAYGKAKSVDFNGDRWPDLVICNPDDDNISVIYNFSQPCPRPVISASGPTSFCTGDSVTLSAPASTSYLWSTGATTQSIVVKSAGDYAVTTTAAGGCIDLHSDTTFVKMTLCDADGDGIPDAQDCDPMDPNSNKVLVCHNGHTICVNQNAVKAHLKHGDYLGNCTGGCDTPSSPVTLKVYPNPNNGHFTVVVNSPAASRGELQIVDMKGNIIERLQVQMAKGMQTFQFHLSKKASGIYVVKLVDERSVRTFKIIFVH